MQGGVLALGRSDQRRCITATDRTRTARTSRGTRPPDGREPPEALKLRADHFGCEPAASLPAAGATRQCGLR